MRLRTIKSSAWMIRREVKGNLLLMAMVVVLLVTLFLWYRFSSSTIQGSLLAGIIKKERFDFILDNLCEQGMCLPFGTIKRDSNEDMVLKLERRLWGAFDLTTASVETKNEKHGKAVLSGTVLDSLTGLTARETFQTLRYVGKIEIETKCRLPRYGFSFANTSGEKESGQIIEGRSFVTNAPMQLPDLSGEFIRGLDEQNEISEYFDTLIDRENNISANFHSKTKVIRLNHLVLKDCNWTGNIKVYAKELVIDSSAHLKDVIIIAEKVRIKKGFKGSIHLICKDSINIEETCDLRYPSSIILREEVNVPGAIVFQKKCSCEGAIIVEKIHGPTLSKVILMEDMNFVGLIYTSGFLQLSGKSNGNVYAGVLGKCDDLGTIENYISSFTIRLRPYLMQLGFPRIFDESTSYRECKLL